MTRVTIREILANFDFSFEWRIKVVGARRESAKRPFSPCGIENRSWVVESLNPDRAAGLATYVYTPRPQKFKKRTLVKARDTARAGSDFAD